MSNTVNMLEVFYAFSFDQALTYCNTIFQKFLILNDPSSYTRNLEVFSGVLSDSLYNIFFLTFLLNFSADLHRK